jgi:hypothetical protein
MVQADYQASVHVCAKLADFGLSEVLDPTRTHLSNYRAGTPFYVSVLHTCIWFLLPLKFYLAMVEYNTDI